MAQSPYSPLMLISLAGLVQNQGLAVNAGLLSAVAQYRSINVVNDYRSVLSAADASSDLEDETKTALKNLGGNILPAVTDAGQLSNQVVAQANTVMGNGNLGKFAQIYSAAQAYIFQNNTVVNSLINSDILSETFVNMDVLTTGNVNDLATDLGILAADLENLGQAWNFNDLESLGYPSTLVRQLAQVAGVLPDLLDLFAAQGITTSQLSEIIRNNGPTDLELELEIYQVMLTVTGSLLRQVKFLLDTTTPDLATMADLLNPAKTLPNSHRLLTVRIPQPSAATADSTTLVPVYLPNGSINSNLLSLFTRDRRYQDLIKVLPDDQALASRVIVRGLEQIKNIFVPSLPDFADAVGDIENNQGLSLITALQQPIPTAIRNSLNSLLATGTGPDGTITLFDMIGAAAGIPYRELYQQLATATAALEDTGALIALTDSSNGVFAVMKNTIAGEYGPEEPDPEDPDPEEPQVVIPGGLPGAGDYPDIDSAFVDGLIPAAISILSEIVASQPALSQQTTALFNNIASALSNEQQNFALTELEIQNLSEQNRSGLMSLAFNLHEIGTDTGPTGSAVYFEAIADRSNIFGQAIVAAMREGRNIEALNNVGIDLDTQIPLLPNS